MYLYETHCHSSQCSGCARSTSQEMVRAYKAAGYAGLVLTDHFIWGNTCVDRSLPWEERMHRYYDAYLEAKDAARGLEFDVIFGIEHQYGDGKEVLIYGIDLAFLLRNSDIPELSLDELVKRVHAEGGLVIMAHPYRDRSYINMAVTPREDLLDGIELYNACAAPGEDLHALALAQRHPEYILTSGGDIHWAADERIGGAGVWFVNRVRDEKELVAALKQKQHHFRVGHKNVEYIQEEHLGG